MKPIYDRHATQKSFSKLSKPPLFFSKLFLNHAAYSARFSLQVEMALNKIIGGNVLIANNYHLFC